MVNLDNLYMDLRVDEGFSSHIYTDTVGVRTIGYGRNLDEGITEEEAQFLLEKDVQSCINDLNHSCYWWNHLPSAAQRGLLNMCFNLGITKLREFHKMMDALQDHDFDRAAKEALDSQWAKQVGDRADRIADLYRRCA